MTISGSKKLMAEGPIGLLAGWGRYPLLVARALKHSGHQVCCLGIKGHADPVLADLCDDFQWIGIAKSGKQIRYFQRRHVRHATMAGKLFKHRLLFHSGHWIRHLPDWHCVRNVVIPHFVTRSKNCNDDDFMLTAVNMFADGGITFGPATDYAPELLVKPGSLSGIRLTEDQQQDVQFGWQVAKQMGQLDIGQSVAVKNRVVLAVEAIEGTDACIQRAGELSNHGDFTVVKVAKPKQDMRFDVPTIGIGTIEALVAAGGRVLAVEAGKTIIIDESQVADIAKQHGVAVVAVHEGQHDVRLDAA